LRALIPAPEAIAVPQSKTVLSPAASTGSATPVLDSDLRALAEIPEAVLMEAFLQASGLTQTRE